MLLQKYRFPDRGSLKRFCRDSWLPAQTHGLAAVIPDPEPSDRNELAALVVHYRGISEPVTQHDKIAWQKQRQDS